MQKKFLVGIDEVGRGPLAGPVTIGVVMATPAVVASFAEIKESKQLSEKKREYWNARIREACGKELVCAVASVGAEEVDAIGIAPAIKKALVAALNETGARPADSRVLLDGGLRAPAEFVDQETIIHGDAKETVIAMASVVAKVARDRHMRELDPNYPGYGFAKHKGYGTAAHIAAIRVRGLSKEHRASFCRNIKK